MATVAGAGTSVIDRMTDSKTRLASNTQTFLSLLTTQLRNQDPLSPLDSNEFTAQITQMTGVEQQLLTNDLLAMLVGMNDGGLSDTVGLIGKTVTAETNEAVLDGGEANWTYNLERNATQVKYEVVNSAGQTVFTRTDKSVKAGEGAFEWDGKTTQGTQISDGGTFTLKVTATGAAGEAIAAPIYTTGVVTAVESIKGQNMATIGNGKIKAPVGSITSIKPTA
ncbi:MAG: flagellar hook capping FlgD N-terminal domain-containing protein [Pseudomonadota bacterium]